MNGNAYVMLFRYFTDVSNNNALVIQQNRPLLCKIWVQIFAL
jgi:hypothetical protein